MRSYLLIAVLVINGSVTHAFVHRRNMQRPQPAPQAIAPVVEVTLQEAPGEAQVDSESGFHDFLQFGQEPIRQPRITEPLHPVQPAVENIRNKRPIRSEQRTNAPIRTNVESVRPTAKRATNGPSFRGQFYSPQVPLSIDPGLISRWNQNQ
jgi:hypothetical protein